MLILYMAGTIISVRKVANVSPKIIVHEIGDHMAAISPPKLILGSKWAKNETKSMFKPIAIGNRPRIPNIKKQDIFLGVLSKSYK